MANSSRSKDTVLPIFIVDAFTKEAFRGNGAAICLLHSRQMVPEDVKQKIAAEMNLSETAFISLIEENSTFEKGKRFGLQWFTPTCEVSLCGHATLASSAVLFSVYNNGNPVLEFETMSGVLKARRVAEGKIEIDLPAYQATPADTKKYADVIKEAVGSLPTRDIVLSESGKLLVRLQDHNTRQQLEELRPRPDVLLRGATDLRGVIVTLKGSGREDCSDGEGQPYDFVSRYFAPWLGVSEDPVTGSAHSVLAPFWSKVLDKELLYARQCSSRGGDLSIQLSGDRVAISGGTVVVVRGHITF